MYYRLVQNHLGAFVGQVFSNDEIKGTFKFFDNVLFEPVEDKEAYPFILSLNRKNALNLEYLFEDILQLIDYLNGNNFIDGWVVFGFINAAKDKRPYKFLNDQYTLKLECNGHTD